MLAGGALLAGHVHVEPRAFLSGNVVVHQFSRIGSLAMVGGNSRVNRDVLPFAMLVGDSRLGLNVVGLRRADVSSAARAELREAFRLLRAADTFEAAVDDLDAQLVRRTAPGRLPWATAGSEARATRRSTRGLGFRPAGRSMAA